jgi:membrane protease YdiL (CAAX protease family)
MLGVETVVERDFQRKAGCRIGIGRACDTATVYLPPARGDTRLLGSGRTNFSWNPLGTKFRKYKPNALREEGQQQHGGERLRAAEPLARKELGHRQDEVFYHEQTPLRKPMNDALNDGSASSEPEALSAEAPAPAFAAAVQPSYARTVFLGPDGLRAGWGFAFYVAIYYQLQFVASRWAGSVDLGANGLWSMMLQEAGVLLAAVVPALILQRIERRPWGVYGLPVRQAFGKLFWVGAVWGFVSISLLLAAMYGLRVFDVGHLALHGARIVKFAAFWAAMFLLVGFFEEFLLRGYSQFTLTRAIGFWPAAVLLSCTFGLIHLQNAGEQWPGSAGRGIHWFLFLFDAAAYREFVVRRGVSCCVGLGRDVFLFSARQRH